MCGIFGSINKDYNHNDVCHSLKHRGPDANDYYSEGNVRLSHLRLSIIELSELGRQPMKLYDRFVIVYNGEIYNHEELRLKYKLKCKSQSDTETLLHLFAFRGLQCLEELDGMFAIALFDRVQNQLTLIRDRAGKKPLYYYLKNEMLLFSSELNAIRGQIDLSIDEDNINDFLRLGYFYKKSTPYKNITELEGGTYLTIDLGNLSIKKKKWWKIEDYYKKRNNDNFSDSLEKVDLLLHNAVRRRVEASDLEVGSFLSGGIDSGLVTAIATQYNPSIKTFTVSFEGEYNEAPLAKMVAEKYGTDHNEINISFNYLENDIEKILCNYGEPFFDSSAIPSFYVSKAAKEFVTVILNGDGGDEIFGGYRRYVPFSKYDFFKTNPRIRNVFSYVHSILPISNDKKSKYNFFNRFLDLAGKRDSLNIYLAAAIDIFEGYEYGLNKTSMLHELREDFDKLNNSDLTGLQKIMCLDFDSILFGDLLVKMDIATMKNSLEGRSPFLCKDLLEYVPGISDSFKIKGAQTKYLLRKLSKKYLPAALINQPKRGFEIPLKKWVDGKLHNIIHDYIMSNNAYCKLYIDNSFLDKLLARKINVGDEKRAKMIWALFTLEVWYKRVANT